MKNSSAETKIVSKGELYLKYRCLKRNIIRSTINRIISSVRGVPIEEAKKQKTLLPKEVRLFQDEFDLVYY